MHEMDPKLKLIVELAMSARPRELGCDDCFDFLAAYADQILHGAEIPEELRLVAEHLDRCSFCMEELDLLLVALREQSTDPR